MLRPQGTGLFGQAAGGMKHFTGLLEERLHARLVFRADEAGVPLGSGSTPGPPPCLRR